MQLLSIPTDHNFSDYLACGIDGFLFPLEDFSCDFFSFFLWMKSKSSERKRVRCLVLLS